MREREMRVSQRDLPRLYLVRYQELKDGISSSRSLPFTAPAVRGGPGFIVDGPAELQRRRGRTGSRSCCLMSAVSCSHPSAIERSASRYLQPSVGLA